MKRFVTLLALSLFGALFVRAQVPQSQHVYIVVEENHSYESVVGQMPYLNSLATQYALLTNSYANSHYSIPNYMWLTTGAYVTLNDNTQLTFDVDNITRYLATAGLSWKEYAEGLPYAGYVGYNLPAGCTSNCVYVERHNPFPYFTEVATSSAANNIVPFTQLAQDIANGTLPNYAFITPNLQNDGHDGTLATADAWLQTNLAPLLSTPAFQPGGDGILIVTFDESFNNDCRPAASCPALPENVGGGRIYTVVVGPQVKPGFQSNVFTEHHNVLRTMMEALGLSSTGFPGAAANVFDLADVFSGNALPLAVSPTTVSVAGGATVQFAANESVSWSANGGSIAPTGIFTAPTTLGAYTVTATDPSGNQASGIVNVIAPPAPVVTFTAPAAGATVTSPVTVSATFTNGGVPQYMKLWVDGVAKSFNNNSTSFTYTLPIPAGNHQLIMQAYNGTLYRSTENITVAGSALSISPATANLFSGQTQQFTASAAVTWSATGGTITSAGLFTAPTAAGTYTVTATDSNGNHASAAVNVTTIALSISPTSANLSAGQTQQFTANAAVTWSATGGTITSAGLYTAPAAAGTYTITATDSTGNHASAAVNVTAIALSVSPTTASLSAGQTQQFTANAAVTWSATGGTITSSGLYTAPTAAGTYTVIATNSDGNQASATVNVSVSSAPTVTISTPAANATLSSPFTLSASFSNGGTASYMKLWIDGVSKLVINNTTTLSTSLTLSSGKHKLTVQAYNGSLYSSFEYVTVQ